MRRNELFNIAAVVDEKRVEQNIQIPDNCKDEFVKAMKIGYYKEFHKQGLITDSQLEKLIQMQDEKQSKIAA